MLFESLPNEGLVASDLCRQRANGQQEVALLQAPTTVVAYEGQVGSGQLKGDGARLTRVECYLVELTQPTTVRSHRGHKVAAEKQYAFLTSHLTLIGDVHADGQHVVLGEVRLVDTQVGILEGGVAQSCAEAPHDGPMTKAPEALQAASGAHRHSTRTTSWVSLCYH